jgi:hypothetical protein
MKVLYNILTVVLGVLLIAEIFFSNNISEEYLPIVKTTGSYAAYAILVIFLIRYVPWKRLRR